MAEQAPTLIVERDPTTARRFAANLGTPVEVAETKAEALTRLKSERAYARVVIDSTFYTPQEARIRLQQGR